MDSFKQERDQTAQMHQAIVDQLNQDLEHANQQMQSQKTLVTELREKSNKLQFELIQRPQADAAVQTEAVIEDDLMQFDSPEKPLVDVLDVLPSNEWLRFT